MNPPTQPGSVWFLTALAMALCFPVASHAEVVLSTDFTGRTVSGKAASNITWTANGVEDPGDLTWEPEGGGPANTNLFDTPNAQDHFAPDLNIENEGPWSTTITLSLTTEPILLEEVVIDWQHFNNAGVFQSVSRSADWTVSVTGSVSGLLDSITAPNVNASSGTETLAFAAPLSLTTAETYDVKIFVVGNGPGNNTGLNAVTLNGEADSGPDTTAPDISDLSPAADATEVAPNTDLVATFDEAVRKGTGSIVIKQAADDAVVESIDVTADQVTVSGAGVTINPTGDLAGLTGFYVQIDPGALEDLSGNPFAGISDNSTWSFSTAMADTTAPAVSTLSPDADATDVAVDAALVVTFDEDVREDAGNIVLRQSSDDTVVESIDVNSGNVTLSGPEVTINLTDQLAGDTRYYVQIDPGAVEDLSGNPFAGIVDNSTWSFTTETTETSAGIILTTDFADRAVSGKTASNIPWTANGVQDPGDLTWVLEGGGPANTNLFDTPAAQDHFAPDLNIENEGPWSTTITLELTVSQVVLEEVVIDWQHFNNAGALQGVSRSADWTVSVTGSASGLLATVTASDVSGSSGVETLTFPSPVPLSRSETYEVKILVVGNGPGNNTGLNAITLLGLTGPGEPFRLAINRDGSDLVFTWDSQSGMLYNLKTSIDLAADLATWTLVEGEIPATPPINIKTIARPGDPIRFYRVEEFPAPPVTVLEENFDGGGDLPADWTTGASVPPDTGTTVWEVGTPSSVGPPAANSTPNCVGTNIDADYGIGTDIWLRTPSIDLTSATGATLVFQQFRDIETGFDNGSIRILRASDASQLGTDLLNPTDGTSSDWEEVTVTLPLEALGDMIQIEFRLESDDIQNQAGWYIDDVMVIVPAS